MLTRLRDWWRRTFITRAGLCVHWEERGWPEGGPGASRYFVTKVDWVGSPCAPVVFDEYGAERTDLRLFLTGMRLWPIDHQPYIPASTVYARSEGWRIAVWAGHWLALRADFLNCVCVRFWFRLLRRFGLIDHPSGERFSWRNLFRSIRLRRSREATH